MDPFYLWGRQHALEKLGFRAIGRLAPSAFETTQKTLRQLPSKAKKLKPEELAKKKFLPGMDFPS